MASLNKVQIIGNCGRDPELRYMADGKAVANVSVATTSRRKNRDTGEITEDTQWHRVTLYERLAEIAGQYVTKGKPIYVEGRLKYGVYKDKDGVEKNSCDIIATELQLLGGRDDGQQRPAQPAQQQRPAYAPAPQRQAPPQQAPRQAPPQYAPAPPPAAFNDMDDDIPF
jgi:single-strand DNA-binding protein